MLKLWIGWKKRDNIQEKSFKDDTAFIQWYNANYKNVKSINGVLTPEERLTSFDILGILKEGMLVIRR